MPDVFISQKGKSEDAGGSVERKFFELPGPNESVEGYPYHNHNPLSSFCVYPHRVEFINQAPNEKVVLIVRRHPITNIGWVLGAAAIAFLPSVLRVVPLFSFLPTSYQMIINLIFYLLSLTVVLQGFLSWFFSVNILTDKRVIDVDFVNLIYRKISDAEISHIEDATVTMGSVVRTLFDYSDVQIQTAAEIEEIEFQAVPHPDKIAKILSELRIRDRI
jgi:hypothetical protein